MLILFQSQKHFHRLRYYHNWQDRDTKRKLMEADKTPCQDNKGSLSRWEFPKLKPAIQE